jgi:hypothetical protein
VTSALTSVATAHQRIVTVLSAVAGMRVVGAIAAPITPPAAVVGPPRLGWKGESGIGGQPLTGQWDIFLVVSLNQYSIDVLMSIVAELVVALETHTPGVVMGASPGTYASPNGAMPAYIISLQMEVGMS